MRQFFVYNFFLLGTISLYGVTSNPFAPLPEKAAPAAKKSGQVAIAILHETERAFSFWKSADAEISVLEEKTPST